MISKGKLFLQTCVRVYKGSTMKTVLATFMDLDFFGGSSEGLKTRLFGDSNSNKLVAYNLLKQLISLSLII